LLDTSIDGSHGGDSRTAGAFFVIFVIAVVLLAVPITVVHNAGIGGVFHFLCKDTFYYLTVARNSTTGFYTFDGELATNGFHPLWQIMLTGLFGLLGRQDQVLQIYSTFGWSVLFTVLGYCAAGLAVYTITGSKLLGVLVIPGFWYFLFALIAPRMASPYGAMNGMESSLSVFFGGLLFCLCAMLSEAPGRYFRSMGFYLLVGINLAVIVLARLDDVFLLLSFCLCFLLLRKESFQSNFKTVAALAMPSLIVLAVYCGFNLYSVGTAIPVSGLEKGGPALSSNLEQLVEVLKPPAFFVDDNIMRHIGPRMQVHILMWFPSLISVLFIMLIGARIGGPEKEGFDDRRLFFLALLAYVIMKALYNLVNVHANHQDYWYYTLSVMVINFVALILFSKIYSNFKGLGRVLKTYAVLLLVGFLVVQGLLLTKTLMWSGSQVYEFWSKRKIIATELLRRKTDVKLVELDDGFISYSLDVPAIHGMGFVVDYKAHLARQKGRFLEYCYRRGFDIIASMQYLGPIEGNASPEDIVKALRHHSGLWRENLNDFNFEMILFEPGTRTSFIRFRPRESL
jgi:hypothetical protein